MFQILNLDGVISQRDLHIWCHTGSKTFATLHITTSTEAMEQKVISQVL